MGIIRRLEPKSLKESRRVCRQFHRVATPLLFQRVIVYSPESLQRFKNILAEAELSRLIKVISFESADEFGEFNLISMMSDLLQILRLPTSCEIYHHQTNLVAKLTGLNSNGDQASTLIPEEIRIVTPGIPYFATALFRNLRKIHIDTDSVQLPSHFRFTFLEELYISCNILGLDMLMDLLRHHGKLQQLYLIVRLTLGPLTKNLLNVTKKALQTQISSELVDSIIENAQEDAKKDAHSGSRVLLASVHRQMIERCDEKQVKELSQRFVALFRLLKEREHESYYSGVFEKIRNSVQNPDVVKTTILLEYQEGELPKFEV